ncbi:MAG: hypothetical protein K2W82_06405 [Candidatus Obscuribacterales bacterium]|nr:hypothetical protein [Candidatus Obscuribacterales bacterium]
MNKSAKNAALLILFCLSLSAFYSGANAQNEKKDTDQEILFYAFLGNAPERVPRPLHDFLQSKGYLKEVLSADDQGDERFRPFLQWRRWAETRQPFLPSLLFCLFSSLLLWSIFPKTLGAAETNCRQEFWKSLLSGAVIITIILTFSRMVFSTYIDWPLGILVVALTQLSLLAGLSVIISLVGRSIALVSGFSASFSSRKNLSRFVELTLGSLLCAAILQIPLFGNLPAIGIRLLMLFALLGAGGIFKQLRQNQLN